MDCVTNVGKGNFCDPVITIYINNVISKIPMTILPLKSMTNIPEKIKLYNCIFIWSFVLLYKEIYRRVTDLL